MWQSAQETPAAPWGPSMKVSYSGCCILIMGTLEAACTQSVKGALLPSACLGPWLL